MPKSAPARHREFELQPWHAALFLALLTALMFFPLLTGAAHAWEDLMEQELPYRVFAADCLRHGEFPFWNPYTFCGMPFFAALQTAVLYPTNLLLTFLIPDGSLGAWWIQFFIVAHYWIAAFGMFTLCRSELKQSGWGALIGAIAYGFSGMMITHFIHQGMIFQFAWLPWVYLCMMRGARLRRTKWFIGGGLLLGMSLHSGHPQITLYTFTALGALAVAMMANEWKSSRKAANVLALAGRSALLAALAAGLWAVQYFPAQELAALAVRAEVTYAFAATGSLQWQQLLTLLIPKFFGSTQATAGNLPFWLDGKVGYFLYWETCFYAGVLPLILAFFGARGKRQPYRGYLLAIAGFALAYALGSNFFVFPLFFQLPLFNKFRNPARVMYLFTLAVAIFAGRGFDMLREERIAAQTAKKSLWRWLAIGVGFGLLLIAAGGSMFDVPDKLVSPVSVQVWIFMLLWVAAWFLIWRLRTNSASPAFFSGAMALLAALDLLIFGGSQNNGARDPQEVYNSAPHIISALRAESQHGLFRVRMREGGYLLMKRNQGPVDRLFLVEGYSPLVLERHMPDMFSREAQEDMMNVRYRIAVDTARGTMGLAERAAELPRARMFYCARALGDSGVLEALKQPFDYHNVLLLEHAPSIALPDSAAQPASTVRVTTYTPDEIRIHAETSENGILFTSEIYYPEWHAYVDGAPAEVLRADGCLRAVALTKGTHDVVFRHESAPFRAGAWISGGVLALSLAALGVLQWKEKKR